MVSKTDLTNQIDSLSKEEQFIRLFAFERIIEHLNSQVEASKDPSFRRKREAYRALVGKGTIERWINEAKSARQSPSQKDLSSFP